MFSGIVGKTMSGAPAWTQVYRLSERSVPFDLLGIGFAVGAAGLGDWLFGWEEAGPGRLWQAPGEEVLDDGGR